MEENEMLNRDMINAMIQKRGIILDKDGMEYGVDGNEEAINILKESDILNKFILEESGLKGEGSVPKSIQAMQNLELVDYEAASDSGHFRFYPKGSLVFDLIKEWAEEIALNRLKSLKIETPLMYNYGEKDIQEQVKSFHESHYIINVPGKDSEFILRFAGDFGLFRMLKDARLSYKNLPMRVYEYSKSFRYERRGSLVGLKRLRAFSMPDIHSFTKDLNEGFKEYKEIYKRYYDLAREMKIQFVPVFRAVEGFYYEHKQEILELVQYGDSPAYIELLSDMKHYWAIKSEFQATDCEESFVQLSTVQLDVKDAMIYGINYLDRDGESKGCIICHSSIGSIERWMYSILEAALMKEKPMLPYWLSPVQLRIIPVSDEYISECEELAQSLGEEVRIDIDDRDERLAKKIRNCAKNWIPYSIVIGEKEKESKRYSFKGRAGDEMKNVSIEEIKSYLKECQNKMPYKALNYNYKLSMQPMFR
jgi:threonyl-tRNA synthetase